MESWRRYRHRRRLFSRIGVGVALFIHSLFSLTFDSRLHEPAYTVSFSITNTGSVAGTEIAQLYVHHPASANEPPSVLKGFQDVYLEAGEMQTVTITLSRYDLSIWDVVSQSWVRPSGDITFDVGASSRDFRLNGQIP